MYIDQWEKAVEDATCLGLQIMKYGHWVSNHRELLDQVGVSYTPIHAVVSIPCSDPRQVAALAALWGVDLDLTGTSFVTATTAWGDLTVEAYAARSTQPAS